MTTVNTRLSERVAKLNERIEKHAEALRKDKEALQAEQAKMRQKAQQELARAKREWGNDLVKKMLKFYPLDTGEIASIVASATNHSDGAPAPVKSETKDANQYTPAEYKPYVPRED